MKRILFLLACVVTLAACGGDTALPDPTGKGAVRVINAIPDSPPVRFLIEERFLSTALYKESSSPARYDDFSYNFNFEIGFPGAVQFTRVATRSLKVEANREHIFLVSGDVLNPDITVWDGDIREFAESDTVLEARFSHASNSLGPIDIYFDPPGTVLGTNPPAATLNFGEITDAADFEAGPVVLTITAANDINTVLFTATESDLLAQFAHIITVFDADANDPGTVAVRSMTSVGNPFTFNDADNPPRIRFINTSFATGDVDIYRDEMLTDLVAAGVPVGGDTGDLVVTIDPVTYYFTPAGSTAQVIFDQAIGALTQATFTHIYIAGTETNTFAVRLRPDRAPQSTAAKISVFQGATNFNFVDVYLVDRGEELSDQLLPIAFGVGGGSLSSVVEVVDGSYDLYLTESGTRDAISAAVPLDLALGDVVELLAIDTVDTAVVDVVNLPIP